MTHSNSVMKCYVPTKECEHFEYCSDKLMIIEHFYMHTDTVIHIERDLQ